jgi:hypothetical protein
MSKQWTFGVGIAVATLVGLFGTQTQAYADAPGVTNVTSAKQVTPGDSTIVAKGTWAIAPGYTFVRMIVIATKTDMPGKGQYDSADATPDPNNPGYWNGSILVLPGTWDVTARLTVKDGTGKMYDVAGIGFVQGVVVK